MLRCDGVVGIVLQHLAIKGWQIISAPSPLEQEGTVLQHLAINVGIVLQYLAIKGWQIISASSPLERVGALPIAPLLLPPRLLV